jgi:hypothetical protein
MRQQMDTRRKILISGLPGGAGCSSLSLALADALQMMKRQTILCSSLNDLPIFPGCNHPVLQLDGGMIFQQPDYPGYIPVELLDNPSDASSLKRLNPVCEFLLIDRFTGLNISGNSWFEFANEVIVVVDARPEKETRSLMLIKHIVDSQPNLPIYLYFNRLDAQDTLQKYEQKFTLRSKRYFKRELPALGGAYISAEQVRSGQDSKSILRLFPNHPTSRMIRSMARQLLHLETTFAGKPSMMVHSPNKNFTERSLTNG